MEPKKVVHVHLKERRPENSDMYFGSLKSIYDHIPYEELGISYGGLANAIRGRTRYENKLVVIRIGTLHRKAHGKTKE